ncbi:MaoC family dehydratase [Thiolinea disciformis]|uniref:MaoC family dehydratase n=1 Tax=Thiolinea disciformis TaxID=125614 RepID=UPI0003616900|nr:MaoC family dehydratase [Thiolinea disciformis]
MEKSLKIGDSASLTRSFTDADVRLYADLSGDHNPVHLDEAFAAGTQFKQRIVHGMLVGSLFTALLGEQLPGRGSIYMTQNLNFKAPVFLNTPVTAKVEITGFHPKKPIVMFACTVVDAEGKTLVQGDSVMYVPWLKMES